MNLPNALAESHRSFISKYYFELRDHVMEQPCLSFNSVKNVCQQHHAVLIHSWLCKGEEPHEFYGVLYGLVLDCYMGESNEMKCVDIFLLYILYGTMPERHKVTIHLTLEILRSLIGYLDYLCKVNNEEVTELISLMFAKRWIVVGQKHGMRTSLLAKNGVVCKDNQIRNLDLEYQLEKIRFDHEIMSDQTKEQGLDSLRQYVNLKETFLAEYVREDPNEVLCFEANVKRLMKESEQRLSLVSKEQITKLHKVMNHRH